jgi:hypothetical protein
MGTAMESKTNELVDVGETFLGALAAQDFWALEACFQLDVRFRALVPSGVRQATDASGAVGYLRRWFGDADSFEVLCSEVYRVAHLLAIAYRICLPDPDGWAVVEQRLYCDVNSGRIESLDLLCSDFLPEG